MIAIYPKIINLAKAGHIESLACAAREYYGEHQAFAKNLDVWRFCQSMGVGLRERDAVAGGLARIVARDERGQFDIVIERAASMCGTLTDQLLIAHLLGHGFLDLLPKIAEGDVTSPAVFSEGVVPILSSYEAEGLWKSGRSLDRERRADHFALALLLPKRYILAALEKFRSVEKVARFFQLPAAVIKARVHSLGIMADADQPSSEPSQQAAFRAERPRHAAQAAPSAPPTRSHPYQSQRQQPSRQQAGPPSAEPQPAAGQLPRSKEPRTAPAASSRPAPLQGISQLRQLAKRIDGSVDL